MVVFAAGAAMATGNWVMDLEMIAPLHLPQISTSVLDIPPLAFPLVAVTHVLC
jgi:hypothetical protein